MPAFAIRFLARSSRWLIVASGTRNIRATCSVLSPATTLRVRATLASIDSAGWQQVKTSRSRSSVRTPVSMGWSPPCWSTSGCAASSATLVRSVPARRITSSARLVAVVVSQAAGLRGTPSRGQVSSARSAASATASSARSQSRVVRMRDATIRSRSPAMACASASWTCSSVDTQPSVGPRSVLDERTQLQSASDRHRVLGGDPDRLVEIGALEYVEPDDPLAGLGVGAVGHQELAPATGDAGGVLGHPHLVAHQAHAGAVVLGDPVLDVEGAGQVVVALVATGVEGDEHQELHDFLRWSVVAVRRTTVPGSDTDPLVLPGRRHMGARSHPRAVAGPPEPGHPDQGRDPTTVRSPGLEELLELGVVERRAGEGPADVLGHVVVAEAHRVRVAVRALPDLGAGPHADARDRPQPPVRLLVAERDRALEADRDPGHGDHRARPRRVDVHPQPLPGRDLPEGVGVRLDPDLQLAAGPGSALAVAVHETAEPGERLLAG